MTPKTQPSAAARRCGPALIILAGKSYAAEHAEYDGHAVSFKGTVRTRTVADADRMPRELTIPIERVERVEWLEERGDVV